MMAEGSCFLIDSHSFFAGILHPQLPQYATSIITFYFTEESAQPIFLGFVVGDNIIFGVGYFMGRFQNL